MTLISDWNKTKIYLSCGDTSALHDVDQPHWFLELQVQECHNGGLEHIGLQPQRYADKVPQLYLYYRQGFIILIYSFQQLPWSWLFKTMNVLYSSHVLINISNSKEYRKIGKLVGNTFRRIENILGRWQV